MFIGIVRGPVVTSQKDKRIEEAKLLLIDPCVASAESSGALKTTGKSLVAIDSLGAGPGEYVLVTQGSSARLTDDTAKMPVDAVVIGIVESLRSGEKILSRSDGTLT